MASSKLNIFEALPQQASDEDEDPEYHKTKPKKQTDKKEERTKPEEKKEKDTKKANPKGTAPIAGVQQKQEKEEHGRHKENKKFKGVTDEPHPHDRHSGTGYSAFGGKPKKGGSGKGNWGNYSGDEKKGGEENEKVVEEKEGEAKEGTTEAKPKEEEKPVGMTLSEYYQQFKQAQSQPEVNEAKAKITQEQLYKEVGNATQLKTRNQQQVDDRKSGKKKDHIATDHHAAITTEHADLLNFRTGFIEKEYKQRNPEDGGQRKTGPRTFNKGEKERENTKEEEGQSHTQGEKTTNEGATGEEQQGTEGQGEERESPKRRKEGGGYRGGRGGYRGGPRKHYGGKQGSEQTKINVEDESAFPKLG